MEKPLRVKTPKARQPPAYYDDSLTGPQPTFKKTSTFQLNTLTAFPPPIPPKEMSREALVVKETPKEETGFLDNVCMVLGIPTKKVQKKSQEASAKNGQKTAQQLKEMLSEILMEKDHQLHQMERARVQMLTIERELSQFLSSGNSKESPLFLNFLTKFQYQYQQEKNAKRELSNLEKREQQTRSHLATIADTEYTNKLNGVLLDYHGTAKYLGMDKKQMRDIRDVNKYTQKSVLQQELAKELAPPPPPDEELEFSDEVQKMVARCDNLAFSRNRNFSLRTRSPSPPPPPSADPDPNLLIGITTTEKEEENDETNTATE